MPLVEIYRIATEVPLQNRGFNKISHEIATQGPRKDIATVNAKKSHELVTKTKRG